MSISQEALFEIALNLEDPWYIRRIDFNSDEKQLDIRVDFKSGGRFPYLTFRTNDISAL